MRPAWTIGVLGLALAACGSAEPDRFSLRTPGAETGLQPPAEVAPPSSPIPVPTASPEPAPRRTPVTGTERRIIKAWADALRGGRVSAASRYFAVPSLVFNNTPGYLVLDTDAAVMEFNRTLPCGAKLLSTRRAAENFVVGIFELTERKGGAGCGTGTGNRAAVAFLIRARHITQWVRVEPDAPGPGRRPEPTEPRPSIGSA